MNRLQDLKDEIVTTQNGMKGKRAEADARAEDARLAMVAAQEAQAEVQRRIEEEARQQAQIAAQAEAMAAAERDNDSGEPATPETGTVAEPAVEAQPEAPVEEPASTSSSEDVAAAPQTPSQDAYTGEDDYVAEWAKRIDAYLAGSPLAGQGLMFAKAAYEYGVDPRFSPAISYTESGKGQYCFQSHNAWGWGSSSWDSWEEAIYDHVAGLSRGYGGQISIEGAKKYCPPNWKLWYERTLGQMEMI
ncbi:MAG: glucosaminidase domain-containing protein [Eggerthellaceae bacterium]|nr:glucosaminidase domain-containing protein [Eggerthellaceae bacterium]